jgi:phage tail-like protein
MGKGKPTPEKFYQEVNFHFLVSFKPDDSESIDTRFQSVAGLDSTLETESIKEGGENHFEHVIPIRRKYGPLVLKRGILGPNASDITTWLKAAFDDEKVRPIGTVDIILLNPEHKALMQWTINNVWPRSWKVGELNAERGEVLIETLELNYNKLIFKVN